MINETSTTLGVPGFARQVTSAGRGAAFVITLVEAIRSKAAAIFWKWHLIIVWDNEEGNGPF